MYLAERLRQIRESKQLSQGDIQNRSGLIRSYISRVENGHSVPTLETLERIAQALEVPLYELLYEDEPLFEVPAPVKNGKKDWTSRGKGLRTFTRFRIAIARMSERDRALLLHLAAKMSKCAGRNGKATLTPDSKRRCVHRHRGAHLPRQQVRTRPPQSHHTHSR
jgi:transcriptional regulator with XRE-family HTH domain